jgi:hypothetical protein
MTRTSELVAYTIAIVLGLGAGYANLEVNDPTLAALLAAMIAMGLGLWKPKRPWRWGLLVGFCIPAAQVISYLHGVPPLRGEVVRACFIGLVSATVAAGLGSIGRMAFANMQRPSSQNDDQGAANSERRPDIGDKQTIEKNNPADVK